MREFSFTIHGSQSSRVYGGCIDDIEVYSFYDPTERRIHELNQRPMGKPTLIINFHTNLIQLEIIITNCNRASSNVKNSLQCKNPHSKHCCSCFQVSPLNCCKSIQNHKAYALKIEKKYKAIISTIFQRKNNSI